MDVYHFKTKALYAALGVIAVTVVGLAAPKAVIEPTEAQVKKLSKAIAHKRRECERSQSRPLGICRELKYLITLDEVLQSLSREKQFNTSLKKQVENLGREVESLKTENHIVALQLKANREPSSFKTDHGCYKPQLLHELMLDHGIADNGDAHFSKIPMAADHSECWRNSKLKAQASVILCNFPLAINILTKGGSNRDIVERRREYIFSLNACDLLTVHVVDEANGEKKESFLTYNDCLKAWNKRTADAGMAPDQVRLMEDTIGICFREHLLPPRGAAGGRINPAVKPPSDWKGP